MLSELKIKCNNINIKFKSLKFIFAVLNNKKLDWVRDRIVFLPNNLSILLKHNIDRLLYRHDITTYDKLNQYQFSGFATQGRRLRGVVKGSQGKVFRTKRRLSHIEINIKKIINQ